MCLENSLLMGLAEARFAAIKVFGSARCCFGIRKCFLPLGVLIEEIQCLFVSRPVVGSHAVARFRNATGRCISAAMPGVELLLGLLAAALPGVELRLGLYY